MSPECIEEVYRYTALITGMEAERSEEHTEMIQKAFTTGDSFTIVSQRTPTSGARAFTLYFSRSGDKMRAVIVAGAVAPARNGVVDSVYMRSTWTGANLMTLNCRGPFLGHDKTADE